MPKSMTMLRAISVARSRSFWAPVEMSRKTISSAIVPASSTWMRLSSSDLVIRYRSPSGRCIV